MTYTAGHPNVVEESAPLFLAGGGALGARPASRNAIAYQGRLDAGVQLISKPFTFEQLAARVRDVLDMR